MQRALEAGANDYLAKPLDLGLLNVRLSVAERQIRDLAERNQARAALQESAQTLEEHSREHDGWIFRRRSGLEFYPPQSEGGNPASAAKRDELSARSFGRSFRTCWDSVFEINYRKVMDGTGAGGI